MHFIRETCVSSDQPVWGTRGGTAPLEQVTLAQVMLTLMQPYDLQCSASAAVANAG